MKDDLKKLYDSIYQVLRTILVPHFALNLVDLGLIHSVEISQQKWVTVSLSFPSSNDYENDLLVNHIRIRLESLPSIQGLAIVPELLQPWGLHRITKAGSKALKLIYKGPYNEPVG